MPGFAQTDNFANIAGGPAWFFYTADLTVAVPTKIDDVVGMASPYTPKTGWINGGALTRTALALAFATTQAVVTTAHTNVPVATRVTGTTATVQVPFQELSPAIIQLARNSPASVSIAAGAGGSGTPAQTAVPQGSVQQIKRRRGAVIIERDPGVTGVYGEGGARGQLVAWLIPQIGISAQGNTISLDPDTTAELLAQFDYFPEPTITDPTKQYGFVVFETGTTVP